MIPLAAVLCALAGALGGFLLGFARGHQAGVHDALSELDRARRRSHR